MRLRAAKGQVLVHVLITAVIVTIISAALMRLVLMRLTISDRLAGGAVGKAAATSGYQLLLDDWACNGTCHNPAAGPVAGCPAMSGNPFVCATAGPNTCGCTCSGSIPQPAPNPAIVVNVTTSGAADSCQIQSQAVVP